MNLKDLNRWHDLTRDGSVRWLKYSCGPGTANTIAVRLEDGNWLVVAPSVGSANSVLAELSKEVGSSWRMDETAVSVRGGAHYLYRAVDKKNAARSLLLLRPAPGAA